MRVESRHLHPDQISANETLRKNQYRMMDELFNHDIEIYDDEGNLVAITSRDNPNLERLLANLSDQSDATGGAR